jgi:hypothetical protein
LNLSIQPSIVFGLTSGPQNKSTNRFITSAQAVSHLSPSAQLFDSENRLGTQRLSPGIRQDQAACEIRCDQSSPGKGRSQNCYLNLLGKGNVEVRIFTRASRWP